MALRNAPAPVPPPLLHALLPHLARLMAASTEHMQLGMAVLTSCVLAGGRGMLDACAAQVGACECKRVPPQARAAMHQ